MIDFEHVSKEYKKGGKLALEDINFHVDDGEFVFLLGHSGAGKIHPAQAHSPRGSAQRG